MEYGKQRIIWKRPKDAAGAVVAGVFALALLGAPLGCARPADDGAEAPAQEQAAQGEQEKQAKKTVYPLTVEQWDGDGNRFEQVFEQAPEKVVCLDDSTAEIMCLLGLADKVVGAVEPEGSVPASIAREYNAIPKLGDKMTLSREVVIGAEPDLVMGKARMFVAENQTDPSSYNDLGIDLYVQTSTAAKGDPTLSGIIEDVKTIARIFDAEDAAEPLVKEMQKRLDAIEDKVEQGKTGDAQSVLVMALFKEGTFATFGATQGASLTYNILDMLGATPASTDSGMGLTYENLIALNPDVIVYITAERSKETDALVLDTLYNEDVIQSVPAIADKRVVEIPYAEFMDATPRIFDSVEKIADVLYPES